MATLYQQQIDQQLELILQTMRNFPQGASSEDIIGAIPFPMGLRTLQRRLETLVEKGELKLLGAKRSAKYHIQNNVSLAAMSQKPDDRFNDLNEILSNESKQILNTLAVKSSPVDYQRAFVDNYRPNIDFYLTEAERVKLANISVTTTNPNQPAGTYAKQILHRLLVDLSWNSSRLEGNTYSLLDTTKLLDEGSAAPNKSAIETQMILNHKDAIEFIVRGGDEIGLNRYTLLNLHAMLANNLLPDPAAPGRLRNYPVGIEKSAYVPTAIPQLIEEMFEQILEKASMIRNPHEQALFVMVQLPYLQPFEDVNKRVSRLAANIPLNMNNLVPISFIGVPEDLYIKGLLAIYELNRTEILKDIFIQACLSSADRYATVRQTISEPDPFRIKYREALPAIISDIITNGMDPASASVAICARALQLQEGDKERFIELVETELLSLHEGNFARYRVTPKEFARWRNCWKK